VEKDGRENVTYAKKGFPVEWPQIPEMIASFLAFADD
jgi:hypothetical protein